jgi:capsule polysaccharide export protein KpsE/RkpR
MSIWDNQTEVVLTNSQKAQAAAKRIRQLMKGEIQSITNTLQQVRNAVSSGGGAGSIGAQLGDDAADMQALYTALKDVVETYSPGSVDPIG